MSLNTTGGANFEHNVRAFQITKNGRCGRSYGSSNH
jgi:hypothetical protein